MFNAYLMAGVAMVFWGIAPIFAKLGLSGTPPLAALTIRSLIISTILLITVTVAGQWGNFAGVGNRQIIL